ncbi:hypothetical protein DUNSADRAFT_9735 [Dunaliella salina]|uniref:Uncharacterized protein n=1 Tax=Dunaliella salina TaxID=3046 RepID=A0ABQ7GGU3_DUNSA|nr:hypothetical protein DUNSADRAFT_9735 [Dunaliella salina]|eukprot:KAF5833826.1 hypothetical protein DUNSADRAFT_9735 [Dunaliella salina]
MSAKEGKNKLRDSLDRARQLFSTPALWRQKAFPSDSIPEPALPNLASGGSTSVQSSRPKSMTALSVSPRAASTTAAPDPTLGRISGTPGGTQATAVVHLHPFNSARSTTAVHGPLSGPLSGDSEALPPLTPQHSGPLTKALPALPARGSLAMSTRPEQSHSPVFSASSPSSAADKLGAHDEDYSHLSLQQLQPTQPHTPHTQRARSRSTPRLRASLDAALSHHPPHPPFHQHHIPPRPPRHPLLSPAKDHQPHQQQHHHYYHHHHHFNIHDHQHYHHQQQNFSSPIVSSSSAGLLRKQHARRSMDHGWLQEDSDPGTPHSEQQSGSTPIATPSSTSPLRKLQSHRSVDLRRPLEDSDPDTPHCGRQSGSTPITTPSSTGPLRKLQPRRSMEYRWPQEADHSPSLFELEHRALKELEELCKLRESRQPEQHDDPALRPASPTLYAPEEDSSLRIPKLRLPPFKTVESSGRSYAQKRRSSCLSLYGTDDEELSAQVPHLSRASTRCRLGAEASAGSGSNHDLDAPPQDFLASSLYRLTAHHPSLPSPPEKPAHLQAQVQGLQPLEGQTGLPPLSHASNPRPPLQQQQQQQCPQTFHSTVASTPPNGPYTATPPGTNTPLRPTPRRTGSVGNIPCGRMSMDATHHRITSAYGTHYDGITPAADMAGALPQVFPVALRSSTGDGSTAPATEPCIPNRATRVSLEPRMADSSGGGSFGSQGSHHHHHQQQHQHQQQQQHGSTFCQHPHPHPPPPQQEHTTSLGASPAKVAHSPTASPTTPHDALSSFGIRPQDEQPPGHTALAHFSQSPPQAYAPHPPPQPLPLLQLPNAEQPRPPNVFGEKCMPPGPRPHPPTSPSPSLLVISPELVCQEGDGLHAPELPSPSDWSKMAAQAADRRHKVSIDKGGRGHPRVSETNPIAFDDEAARGAEADYRAAAGHAHECIQGLSSAGASDPKASTHFLDAVHDLQAHRPYFVSPVRRREVVSRAPFKEDSPPPDDSEHADREQQAAGPQDWTLQNSIFANRGFDSPEVLGQQFAKDWLRLASKPRLRKIVLRLLPAGATEADLEQELAKVRDVFATHQMVTRAAFLYYSCLGVSVGLDSMMVLHLPDFHAFTRDCNIADPKAPGAKPTELETAFIAANFDEGTEVTELKRRCAVDGILRFEFMELLIRVSISKFLVPKGAAQLSEAVSKLFKEHLIPHLPEATQTPADRFRHRFYTQEVEAELLQYWDLLRAVFKVYKAKDHTKLFWPDHWLALLADLNLLGPHTGVSKTGFPGFHVHVFDPGVSKA